VDNCVEAAPQDGLCPAPTSPIIRLFGAISLVLSLDRRPTAAGNSTIRPAVGLPLYPTNGPLPFEPSPMAEQNTKGRIYPRSTLHGARRRPGPPTGQRQTWSPSSFDIVARNGSLSATFTWRAQPMLKAARSLRPPAMGLAAFFNRCRNGSPSGSVHLRLGTWAAGLHSFASAWSPSFSVPDARLRQWQHRVNRGHVVGGTDNPGPGLPPEHWIAAILAVALVAVLAAGTIRVEQCRVVPGAFAKASQRVCERSPLADVLARKVDGAIRSIVLR
jgi:hypothetical protein